MSQIYANVNASQSYSTNTWVYLPFIGGTAGSTPTFSRSLAMPFGGTLTLDIVAQFSSDPGTFDVALRRNQVASDLDTDSVTPGSSGPVDLSLSASGWTKGDVLHLRGRVSSGSPNIILYFTIDDA